MESQIHILHIDFTMPGTSMLSMPVVSYNYCRCQAMNVTMAGVTLADAKGFKSFVDFSTVLAGG